MPWTPLRTYVTGELVTAAILNTDHRDNLKEFYRVRQTVTIGGASANLVEVANTGAQSYPGYPLIFELHGTNLTVDPGVDASITLHDGAGGSLGTAVSLFCASAASWTGDGSIFLTPSVASHTYRLVFNRSGNGSGGGGMLVVWERGG